MEKHTQKDYLDEIQHLKMRLQEAEETIRAIRNGEVDALVVSQPHGDEIFELKGAEHLYRIFVDTMNEGAATFTPEGTVLYCNDRLANVLKTSSDRVVGSSIYQFIPLPEMPTFKSAIEEIEKKDTEIDISLKRENQDLVPVHLSLNAFPGQDLPVICMVAMDLTERKRAEEKIGLYQKQLRALAAELALSEERERKRLASELHDRVGQTLALAKMKLLDILKSNPGSDIGVSLAEITRMIDTTIQDTHSLIFEISPPVLYQVGFEAAVEWLVEHFLEQYGLSINLKIHGKPKPLKEDLRIVLFQAIRELLFNVVKHAQATRAKISVRYMGGDLRILVEDYGLGFASHVIERHATTKGFGLFNIKERLHHLGAEIKIESSPGKGTKVVLIVPLGIRQERRGRKQNGYQNSTC